MKHFGHFGNHGHHQHCESEAASCESSKPAFCRDDHEEFFGKKLFEIAMEAKKELLKEKMKAHFEAKCGKKMDELAAIMADGIGEKFELMLQFKKSKEETKQKLKALFQ